MSIKLQNIDVHTLNRLAKKRNIYCMGCGKRFYELIQLYSNELFVRKIRAIFDNNPKLWGEKTCIDGRIINITNPQSMICNNEIILVTTDNEISMVESVESILASQKKRRIYRYPRNYYKWYRYVDFVARLFPLKRQVLFYGGNEPHDNADEIIKYLKYEYKGKTYSIIMLSERCEIDRNGIEHLDKYTLKHNSRICDVFKFCLTYNQSKFICYENEPLQKKNKRQYLLFLNHGTIPLKNVKDVLRQPNEVDYGICPGLGCADLYKEQYNIGVEKQIYMMPARVHTMLTADTKASFIDSIGKKQIILWLPTFRRLKGSERCDSLIENSLALLMGNCREINCALEKNNQFLIVKMHPREKQVFSIDSMYSSIKLLSEEELDHENVTLQSLLKQADALLTDYSGIAFEYMVLDRPIGYIINDLESYTRGFAMSNYLDYMPGNKIKTFEDFMSYLDAIHCSMDTFREERRKLVKRLFGDNVSQNGAELLVEFFDKVGKNGK